MTSIVDAIGPRRARRRYLLNPGREIGARIEGASRTRSLRSGGTGFLEDVHELVVPAGDLGDGLLSGRLLLRQPTSGSQKSVRPTRTR